MKLSRNEPAEVYLCEDHRDDEGYVFEDELESLGDIEQPLF